MSTHVDWPRRKAYVEPSNMKGRSQWLSAGQPLHFDMCQAIEATLASSEEVEGVSIRGQKLLEDLREEFKWLELEGTTLLIDGDRNATWWTLRKTARKMFVLQRLEKWYSGKTKIYFTMNGLR